MTSPRGLGFRLPAEWEPQEAVWLSWPVNRETWVDCWDTMQEKFAEIALKLSQYETVFINLAETHRVAVEAQLSTAENLLGLSRGKLRFFDHPVNDVWVRDHGPVYLCHKETSELAMTNWIYNGWGGKYPYDLDNRIPQLIQQATEVACFYQTLVLEGGSLETNGEGDLLVTTDCLLNPNRNPQLSEKEISQILIEGLGVNRVHWLDGCLEGDDTDGHIDNLVRFFKPDGVLVAATDNADDANFSMLERLHEQCLSLELVHGKPVEVVKLPLPEPVIEDGRRLPMSYLNFLITNDSVFVPVFCQADRDRNALEILQGCFPDRVMVPINCRQLILEGGALHCMTQQVPRSLT
jgi:agmatine deiminase